MSNVLLSKIAAVRRREQSVGAGMAVSLAIAYLVVALALGMLLDWQVELPWVARGILAAIDAGVVTWLLIEFSVRSIICPADDETLALAVERIEPRFEGRLICSVQLSRDGAIPIGSSRSVAAVMIEQAVDIAASVNFTAAVKADLLIRRAAGALVILMIAGALFASFASASLPLLQRALLMPIPVPRKTQIAAVSRDKVIAIGDSFTIEATTTGITPAAGKAVLQYASGVTQETPLNQVPLKHNDFAATLNSLQETFRYTVHLGDNHGQTYTVTTAHRPMVTALRCWQVFPAYTRLPPIPKRPADLGQLLRGSRLILSIDASKSLKNTTSADVPFNRIHLSGAEPTDSPLIVNPSVKVTQDHLRASAASDANGIGIPNNTTGMSIFLIDPSGIESRDAAVYPISLIDKNRPIIKLLSPRESELLALPTDTLLLEYKAHDDFALGGLSLHYKVGDDGPEQSAPIPLDGAPAEATATFPWAISSVAFGKGRDAKLTGTTMDCWLRAIDTDDVSNPDHQPNFGDSDHFQVRIVTQQEIDAHLRELQHDALGALGTMTREQQQINDDFAHGLQHAATQPAPTR